MMGGNICNACEKKFENTAEYLEHHCKARPPRGCSSCASLRAEVERLRICPICGSGNHNFCTKDVDSLRAESERYKSALRRIAGELGEFADADGDTMVEKIRFFREEVKRLDAISTYLELKLCASKEALTDGLDRLASNIEHGRMSLTADSQACAKMEAALSPSLSPCQHEAEAKRLRELATLWYLADGTHVTLTEEEVIEKRKAAAKKLATLDRLSAIVARVEDVEQLGDHIRKWLADNCTRNLGRNDLARAVRDYAIGEG